MIHKRLMGYLQVSKAVVRKWCFNNIANLQLGNSFPEIGNEEQLKGIEIVGDDVDFYKIINVESHEDCQNECKKRFFCRSW